jgi:hypothetical protein
LIQVWDAWPWVLLSFGVGAMAGFSEIASRYRDEPLLAIANLYGVGYTAVNGLAAVAAYGVLLRYPKEILPPLAGDPLITALTAGFGAMAVLRSKLFIFRAEDGKEYPIGPSIVMETFLRVLDRKIDRLRASKRQQRVFEKMKDITDFNGAADYLEASLLSFQNLSDEEKGEIRSVLQQYRTMTAWPETLKTMAVGFAFLTIAGEENFDQVIANLKSYLAALQTKPVDPPEPGAPKPPGGTSGP